MGLNITNFGKCTVSTGYAAGVTTIVLTSGHGAKLPSTYPFWLVWWDSTLYANSEDDPNVEIVKVTNRSTDTLTVVRGQDGTSDVNHNTGGSTYKMSLDLVRAFVDLLQQLSTSPSQGYRNLRVRTHPDVTDAPSKIRVTADEITMDDGTKVASWDATFDIAAAVGAGGLDAGAEENSVGYEVWAIRKSSDGTKNVIGHKAKILLKDEDQTSGSTAQPFRDASARQQLAQGFQVDTTGLLEKFTVQINSVTSTPSGNWYLEIQADSSGNPSNTPLATSNKYDIARITNGVYSVTFYFEVPTSLTALTQYHAVLRGTNTINGTAYFSLRGSSSDVYARGSCKQYDGSSWSAASAIADMIFQAYISTNTGAVTMPTGYDQKALVCPWAYNNGSGNFKRFEQNGNIYYCRGVTAGDWYLGQFTNTTLALTDLSAFIPPRPTRCWFKHESTVTAVGAVAVGDLTCKDLETTFTQREGMAAGVPTVVAASGKLYSGVPFVNLLPPYQACYIECGNANNHQLYLLAMEVLF